MQALDEHLTNGGFLPRAWVWPHMEAPLNPPDPQASDAMVIAAREVLKGHVPEGVLGDFLRPAITAALKAASNEGA